MKYNDDLTNRTPEESINWACPSELNCSNRFKQRINVKRFEIIQLPLDACKEFKSSRTYTEMYGAFNQCLHSTLGSKESKNVMAPLLQQRTRSPYN